MWFLFTKSRVSTYSYVVRSGRRPSTSDRPRTPFTTNYQVANTTRINRRFRKREVLAYQFHQCLRTHITVMFPTKCIKNFPICTCPTLQPDIDLFQHLCSEYTGALIASLRGRLSILKASSYLQYIANILGILFMLT